MAKKKKKEQTEQTDKEIRIFYEDLNIADALLRGDKNDAMEFYFKGCYPLFKALFNNDKYKFYLESCWESCEDFMTDVYVYILYPNDTGKRPLEGFKGESTLRCWIKSTAIFYCLNVVKKLGPITLEDKNPDPSDNNSINTVTIIEEEEEEIEIDKTKLDLDKLMRWITKKNELSDSTSIIEIEEQMDKAGLDRKTIDSLISKMKNERYARFMRLFLIEHCSKDEIATMEKVTETVCNNTLSRAEKQFKAIYDKEVRNV